MNRGGLGALVVIVSTTITAPRVVAQDELAGRVSPVEMSRLKTQLEEQQKQIEQLRAMLEEQKRRLEAKVPEHSQPYNLGQVASTAPVLPRPPLDPAVLMPQKSDDDAPGSMQVHLGNAYLSPVGFMDMTSVTRSTNPGSGIGTNFGGIPYGNTQAGSLSETRLSPQNSRIGMRIDTGFKGANVMGYWESDFLGQTGNPPNGGLAVSSNPYVFRLRLFWVNVHKGKFDFLAGQSWSLMTPGRKGISPLPADLFYSQDIDVNYQAGLVWGRMPGFRAVYHPNSKVAFGVALENSEPYVGGGNGGSAIAAPAAIAGILGTQVNNGGSVIGAAALHPDIVAKLAFDPSSRLHFEIAGVEITNKIANPASTPAFRTSAKAGGGGSVNINFELFRNFRIVSNNYWSSGGGRYIFGQAPDFTIRADGSLSLVRSGSTVTGFEAIVGRTAISAYYGGVYIAKNTALDANGKTLIGYGGLSSDGQNRAIQEITFGTNTKLAGDSRWGALNLMFQYSYLQRNPWFAAMGAPSNASLSMGFVNLRYTLPGAPAAPREYK